MVFLKIKLATVGEIDWTEKGLEAGKSIFFKHNVIIIATAEFQSCSLSEF